MTAAAAISFAPMDMMRNVGGLLRDWRQRRRLSQLDLALEANISQRHLSYVESGRARPSRDMLLRLAEQLEIPLRDRNLLLVAGGFAPVFPERPLTDPALRAAQEAMGAILAAQEPFPALAMDRHWTLVAANAAVPRLLGGVAPELLRPPVNLLRLSLHPDGLAPRIVNLPEWREHLLARLRRQIDLSADPVLSALLEELRGYRPPPSPPRRAPPPDAAALAVPLQLSVGEEVLSFLSATTVFGTPIDITLSELALESFWPADEPTREALRRLAA
jgi:transcriptional regulator with XRE-family HTH domain